eukprot:CAMPEP_0174850666 /NCGR_PEP_ID=MMETSP1114-20130205/20731_1 /TAXON_ID=312471 /ORGANISM="Neobodo designis, Strain CCAP 1951/1" /LENGTH=122 /DNA_ID=CAMNT_0016085143 /DNA_START=1 /DNA_END=370 /DNA_ORIENTATION=-
MRVPGRPYDSVVVQLATSTFASNRRGSLDHPGAAANRHAADSPPPMYAPPPSYADTVPPPPPTGPDSSRPALRAPSRGAAAAAFAGAMPPAGEANTHTTPRDPRVLKRRAQQTCRRHTSLTF